MAQYYSTSALTSRLNTNTAFTASRAPVLDEEDLNQSIYIFPNPSSLQGTSRSRSPSVSLSVTPSSPFTPSSAFSGISDYDWSRSAASPSRHATASESGGRGRGVSVTTAADELQVEAWNWEDEEYSSQDLEDEVDRRSRWDILSRGDSSRRLRTDSDASPSSVSFTISSLSPSMLSMKSPIRSRVDSLRRTRSRSQVTRRYDTAAPHPAIRIPLFSFISSFLSIDESTVHLIRHTPGTSVLFPSSPHDNASEGSTLDDPPQHVHGLSRLFPSSSSEDDHSIALKKGLGIMYEKDEEARIEEDGDWIIWRWMRWAVGQ
ncbi:hypothetical protein GLOTRDRAFT_139145 [Gloeophyllum trabeum ATCC 11539]|uniref:Uncharacterized protein n=1 Tax=Gloeophyllum trabeum (strain ATCC 11539 / FP-39264 / Madison 617) TaxID=670483 RepID=S7Q509_GLOTA|nr:uncharacterized protein GLOTRDRAFT_139145 [Gloeophyllum trabeum ATCC 11539]EPQ54597.1 hypothetical protein GLOTRDRAFT_139145 [Gloeophyllum trabeum ATCC 11539]